MGLSGIADYDHFNAISAAIASDPGVFETQAERDAFQTVMNHAIANNMDSAKKLAIVKGVGDAIKGGLTGGLSGAIFSILGSLA